MQGRGGGWGEADNLYWHRISKVFDFVLDVLRNIFSCLLIHRTLKLLLFQKNRYIIRVISITAFILFTIYPAVVIFSLSFTWSYVICSFAICITGALIYVLNML